MMMGAKGGSGMLYACAMAAAFLSCTSIVSAGRPLESSDASATAVLDQHAHASEHVLPGRRLRLESRQVIRAM